MDMRYMPEDTPAAMRSAIESQSMYSASAQQPQSQPQFQHAQQQQSQQPQTEYRRGGGSGGGTKGGGEMDNRGWRRNLTAIAALITALAAFLTAAGTYINAGNANTTADKAQRDASKADKTSLAAAAAVSGLEPATAGSLEEGQKLCRVLQGKSWRDGMIVPKNWTIRLCEDYMRKTEGTDYQLGCATKDNVYLASPPRAIPTPNCGWN
jgi:hypothetical protein